VTWGLSGVKYSFRSGVVLVARQGVIEALDLLRPDPSSRESGAKVILAARDSTSFEDSKPQPKVFVAPVGKSLATFALPTDDTDLNHVGILLRFANGITFYDTGDAAFAERLPATYSPQLPPKQRGSCLVR